MKLHMTRARRRRYDPCILLLVGSIVFVALAIWSTYQ
jgi:hypothetical protein